MNYRHLSKFIIYFVLFTVALKNIDEIAAPFKNVLRNAKLDVSK